MIQDNEDKEPVINCGSCRFHWPGHAAIPVPLPPIPQKIARPQRQECVQMLLCNSPDSPRYQGFLSVGACCGEHQPVEKVEVTAVPLKIANRMNGN